MLRHEMQSQRAENSAGGASNSDSDSDHGWGEEDEDKASDPSRSHRGKLRQSPPPAKPAAGAPVGGIGARRGDKVESRSSTR